MSERDTETHAGAAGAVDIRGVSKHYGDVGVLRDVSVCVPPGTFLTLLGPSGCGKTTLLRLIAGFTEPSSGAIAIDGRDVAGVPTQNRPIGMVFQNLALFPHYSVAQNVAYGLKLRRIPAGETARRVERFMDLVGLAGYGERRISQLSGGQKQRVALARSLVLEPSILLLDEPLSALDQQLRRQLQFALKDIQRKLGTTFVFVTHDQEEATLMSDVIVVMNAGRIQQVGSPGEIYQNPQNLFVSRFVGEINEMPCEVVRAGGGELEVRTPAGGLTLPAAAARGFAPAAGAAGVLCIRPEQLHVRADAAARLPGMVSMPGSLVEELDLGPVRRTTVAVAGRHLRSLTVGGEAARMGRAGAPCAVLLRPQDLRLYESADARQAG